MENPDQSIDKVKVHTALLLVIIVVNVVGLSLIYRSVSSLSKLPENKTVSSANTKTQTTPPPVAELEQLKAEVSELRAETRQLKSVLGSKTKIEGLADALPDLDLIATQSVTISDARFNTVDVHELPLASSKVIGYMQYAINYEYTSKQGEWYQIILPDGTFAWVTAQLVSPI